MKNVSALENIHKHGLFGNHDSKDELINIREIKDVLIYQIVKYKKSSISIDKIKIDNLNLPQTLLVSSNANTLKNLINTCKYKKSLIKLNDIDCIKEGKLSINPKNLKFMKKTDEKLLKKYFPDEVILFFNNPELLNKQLTISGINKLENCSAKNKTGGKTKKMRSTKRKRTKKR